MLQSCGFDKTLSRILNTKQDGQPPHITPTTKGLKTNTKRGDLISRNCRSRFPVTGIPPAWSCSRLCARQRKRFVLLECKAQQKMLHVRVRKSVQRKSNGTCLEKLTYLLFQLSLYLTVLFPGGSAGKSGRYLFLGSSWWHHYLWTPCRKFLTLFLGLRKENSPSPTLTEGNTNCRTIIK